MSEWPINFNEEHDMSIEARSVARRAFRLFKLILPFLKKDGLISLRIAGSAMTQDNYGDIDLFPSDEFSFKQAFKGIAPEAKTKNATTYKLPDGTLVQLCNYALPTLDDLIDSFDFAHIQVGAEIIKYMRGDAGVDIDVYWTNAFRQARFVQDSWYTGSEYPLSSLLRLQKYRARGDIKRGSAIKATIDILNDILNRGFGSLDDFKDQMDAIDLGLVGAELPLGAFESLQSLYEHLLRG